MILLPRSNPGITLEYSENYQTPGQKIRAPFSVAGTGLVAVRYKIHHRDFVRNQFENQLKKPTWLGLVTTKKRRNWHPPKLGGVRARKRKWTWHFQLTPNETGICRVDGSNHLEKVLCETKQLALLRVLLAHQLQMSKLLLSFLSIGMLSVR